MKRLSLKSKIQDFSKQSFYYRLNNFAELCTKNIVLKTVICTFVILKKVYRNILAVLLASFVLLVQGGFYALHHHSLEVEAHKCVHDGEHDFNYTEDCDTCDLFANLNLDISTLDSFQNPEFQIVLFQSLNFGLSGQLFLDLRSRAPPA